ncbi:DUF3102 domain-containing protein [Paucibacter sp. B2R-40]|uniref:DUF3102 domain-containing protein n=1 Tax=Paucibacter sp. B2R-40 TaxID=2893554 RepID=UPI0021E435E1|nr:DUF3102 domain-containing protein [Paucibacter sp. B2R-40]MCV2354630.1 DUF3102 domain-containing protein [Paucibacter sp. B2R-40]
MNALSIEVVAQIGEHHRLAQAKYFAAKDQYAEAVDHARRAGALLLQVKADLGHGKFLAWLEQHVEFTPRTAQRYMSAAAPTPKCDKLTHSRKPPKAGSARAKLTAQIDLVRHRDDVIAHAAFLAAELPIAHELRATDLQALTGLRDRINEVLGGGAR